MDLDKLPYFAIKQDNDDIIVYNTTSDVEIDYDLDKNIHPLSIYSKRF
jgi:outer membrane phospholipase A